MRRWLSDSGYYRCTRCDTWKRGVHPIGKLCKPCEKQRHIERYQRQKSRNAGICTEGEKRLDTRMPWPREYFIVDPFERRA